MLPFPNSSSFNLTKCVNRHIFNSLSSPFLMWIPTSYSNCTWLYSRVTLGTIAGLYLTWFVFILMCTYVWSHTHSHIPTHKFFTWLTDKCMHITWLSSCRFLLDHFSFTADFCDSSKYDLELLLHIFEYNQVERIIFYHVSFASDLLMIVFSPLISWRHFSTI